MVSSCELSIDELGLTGQKAYVPYYLSALLQESDRVEIRNSTGEIDEASYRASRETLLMRLDLLGCTAKLAEQRFLEWRKEEIRDHKSYLEDSGLKTRSKMVQLEGFTPIFNANQQASGMSPTKSGW